MQKTVLKLLWVQKRKHTRKSIVGGDAIRQFQYFLVLPELLGKIKKQKQNLAHIVAQSCRSF
jgi:hypothetical protein